MATITTFRVLVAASAVAALGGCAAADPQSATTSAPTASTAAGDATGLPTVAELADRTQPVLVGGVELDPDCEPPPDGEAVEAFFATLLTGGGATRVLPGSPEFPSDYCPEDALWATRGGRATRGTGTIGDWAWVPSPGSCALPGAILWSIHEIGADSGTISVLEESQVIFPDGCGPAAPCAAPLDFDGVFTVLDGTGRYQGARGTWRLESRQRGDGTTAGVLCGWLAYADQA